MSKEHLLIIGPPGSGKGTQAVRVASELGIVHLSTGDILREAVKNGTELGAKARGYMEKGALVPDELMLGLIGDELDRLGDSGWILDGFPRTMPQAEALDGMLDERRERIDRVILVDLDFEVIVKRITSRRVCPVCGAVYNLETLKPKVDGKCDKCGADLVIRPDDREETVRHRLDVYKEQTEPVIDFYRKKGNLVAVNGEGKIEEITAEIIRALK
ncbi:MAG: adenylate kinase [Candidatus Latescibacteria bacterium 4484_7]|nr:MAG: adenylate kinase [Candidatus Latescibacteria bacterium 4484_7]